MINLYKMDSLIVNFIEKYEKDIGVTILDKPDNGYMKVFFESLDVIFPKLICIKNKNRIVFFHLSLDAKELDLKLNSSINGFLSFYENKTKKIKNYGIVEKASNFATNKIFIFNGLLYKKYKNKEPMIYKINMNEIKKYISYYHFDFIKYYLNDFTKINANLTDSIKNITFLYDDLNEINKRILNLKNKINSNKKFVDFDKDIVFENNILNESCPVCTEKYINNINSICCLLCNHLICYDCVMKIENDECPLCRAEYDKSIVKPNKHIIDMINNDKQVTTYISFANDIKELKKFNKLLDIVKYIISNRKNSILQKKEYLGCVSEEIDFWKNINENSEINIETITLMFTKRTAIECHDDDDKKCKKQKIE